MLRYSMCVLSLILVAVMATESFCQQTGPAGEGARHANMQPWLAINHIIRTEGSFDAVGEVKLFAGNFTPRDWAFADGSLLPISTYTDLFPKLGTTFGGDSRTTLALPDLRGRTAVHPGSGNGPGLTRRRSGERFGVEDISLSVGSMPWHNHVAPVQATGFAGGGSSHASLQPSLDLHHIIALQGTNPSRNPSVSGVESSLAPSEVTALSLVDNPLIGAITGYAGFSPPPGFAFADGQLLPISQNDTLFSILGTTYGGDGRTTFDLRDLRGRAAVHVGHGPGLTDRRLGRNFGAEHVTLTVNDLPSHAHSLTLDADTQFTGGGGAHDNMQPSLALNYMIAIQGQFPFRNTADSNGLSLEPFFGEIQMFAGNFAPQGWAMLDGQLLPINQNESLFSILGTTFGSDGRTTFALPDLRGRAAVHAGTGPGLSTRQLGSRGGSERVSLTTQQLPAHQHGHIFYCDLNGDGAVDAADISEVFVGWGDTGSGDIN